MEPTVLFREFEERDIDFVYRCKNDEKLNSMIVGQWHPFTYEEAKKWVAGCMGEHETYRFWAICTNDEEKRIIGWVSLSNIDKKNQSAYFHGIVVGDREYNDGFAWIEAYLFIYEYVFETCGLNRLNGSAIVQHKLSNLIAEAMYEKQEGVFRQAVLKDGKFHDVAYCAILKDEYFSHKNAGEFEITRIIRRIGKLKRKLSI